jgi:hypothetical protein
LESIKNDLINYEVITDYSSLELVLWAFDTPVNNGAQLGNFYAATSGTSSNTTAHPPQLSGGSYAETITPASPDQQGLVGQEKPSKALHVILSLGTFAALHIKAVTLYDPTFAPCPSPEPTPEPCPDDDDDDCYDDDVCFVPKRCAANWSLLV